MKTGMKGEKKQISDYPSVKEGGSDKGEWREEAFVGRFIDSAAHAKGKMKAESNRYTTAHSGHSAKDSWDYTQNPLKRWAFDR